MVLHEEGQHGAQQHRVSGVAADLAGDEVSGNDARSAAVHRNHIDHLDLGPQLHSAEANLSRKLLVRAEKQLLEFETITLAPIDLALVEPSLLSAEEREWLNAYHAKTRAIVSPYCDEETKNWLEKATRAI